MRKAEKKPETPEKRRSQTVKVNTVRLTVRKKPSLFADVVRYVTLGEELEVFRSANEEWYKVRDGYVMKEFVS